MDEIITNLTKIKDNTDNKDIQALVDINIAMVKYVDTVINPKPKDLAANEMKERYLKKMREVIPHWNPYNLNAYLDE